MSRQRLQELIERLDANLREAGDEWSPAQRERLATLVERLRLAAEEDDLAEDLADSIRESLAEFQAAHPRLTAVLNDLAVTLANLGI